MMEDPNPRTRKKGNLYFSPERSSTSNEYFQMGNGQVYTHPLPTQSHTANRTTIGRPLTPNKIRDNIMEPTFTQAR